jgi:hypothetical protein
MSVIEAQTQSSQSRTSSKAAKMSDQLRAFLRRLTNWCRWPAARTWAKAAVALQGLVVFAVCCGVHAYLAPYGVDPHHDGIMFKPALDVSQGKMVFRDTFTQYGGVTVLLQAAALKLFGARLIVIKMQTAVMYGLAFTVFWRAWCRLMPCLLATFICTVGALLGPDSIAEALPWSSVYALFFQGLALLLAMRYMENGRERELVFAGGAAALAFWCRQPVGVFLAVGMGVALVAITLRMPPAYREPPSAYSTRLMFGQSGLGRACGTALLFGGGAVIVNGIILLWLASFGALQHWWLQSIVLAKIWSETTGHGHSLAFVLDCLFPAAGLRIWCFLAIAAVVQALRTGAPFLDPKSTPKGSQAAYALLASAVAVTSWLQYYPVPCNYHCYWAAIPMLGVFVHLFYSSHESSSPITRSLVAIAVSGLLFYNDATLRIDAVAPHIQSQNTPIESVPALRGMRVNAREAQNYAAFQAIVDAYLRARPDGTIVTNWGDGLFPALSPKQASYHPFYMNWSTITPRVYPDWSQAFLKYVAEHRPLIVGQIDDPKYVQVGVIFLWSFPYYFNVPVDTHPTEFVDCHSTSTCQRRPL